MSIFWSKLVQDAEPYIPGEQPDQSEIIKLNTNENPYPPSPQVLKAIQQAADENLRLYPSPTVDRLKKIISDYYSLQKDQVFIGNGSDEVLAFSFMAFFNPGEKILFPDITYSFYPVYAKLFHIDYETVPLNEDFTIPVEQFFHAVGGVIFPNPNAPTGISLKLEKIEKIIENNPNKVVIIDEAYVDFGCESAVKLIHKYNNLLVIQTLSKSRSLAGLRIGYALGSKDLIVALNRIKNSFNSYTLDRLAIAGAEASFLDNQYFKETVNKIIKTREVTSQKLRKLGFEVIPSKANFLFIKHPQTDAEKLYFMLKQHKIYVRYFKKPRIQQYLRVTIGTDEQMAIFCEKLEEIIFKE
jgi:histidinol-phosphate aminotransferase